MEDEHMKHYSAMKNEVLSFAGKWMITGRRYGEKKKKPGTIRQLMARFLSHAEIEKKKKGDLEIEKVQLGTGKGE
jgi:predicted CopG family antitoxin